MISRLIPVFAGMTAASAVGIFVIQVLGVTFQTIRERSSVRFRRLGPRPGALPVSPPRAGED